MFLFNRNAIKPFNFCTRLYSLGKKCPYDVLKLRKNCTDKEIKEAFIRMSKQYHPDKNKDSQAQERFVHIVEAYNVIGKPSSRAQYDAMSRTPTYSCYYKTHVPWNLRNNPSYHYQYQRTAQTAQPPRSKSYYGAGSMKKLPNYIIIMICCGFALVGLVVQMLVIRQSFIVHRDNIDEKSRIATEQLRIVRATADENGNELITDLGKTFHVDLTTSMLRSTGHRMVVFRGQLFRLPDIFEIEGPQTSRSLLDAVILPEDAVELQTRLLLEKIVKGAKPTVATASLGQALAHEKKESPSERVLTEYGLSEDTGVDTYNSSFKSSIKRNPLGLAFEIETWFE